MIDYIIGIICSALSAMGVGGGGLLVIYLSNFKNIDQLNAQGINLLFFIPSAIISLFLQKKILFKNKLFTLLICFFGTAASLTASLAVSKIESSYLKKGFGFLMLFGGIYQLIFAFKKAK